MRTIQKRLPCAAWMLLLIVTGACGAGGGRDLQIQRGAAPLVNDSIYVAVTNDHYSDARVYVLYDGGARYSLGLIIGKTKGPLTAVLWQPRPLAFEISFIAAEGLFYSDDLLLEAGDVIQLRIPPNISSSAFFRRGSQDE